MWAWRAGTPMNYDPSSTTRTGGTPRLNGHRFPRSLTDLAHGFRQRLRLVLLYHLLYMRWRLRLRSSHRFMSMLDLHGEPVEHA
jgi:hypothetical protein